MQGARIITFKENSIIPASVLIASNACISGDMVIENIQVYGLTFQLAAMLIS